MARSMITRRITGSMARSMTRRMTITSTVTFTVINIRAALCTQPAWSSQSHIANMGMILAGRSMTAGGTRRIAISCTRGQLAVARSTSACFGDQNPLAIAALISAWTCIKAANGWRSPAME